MAEGVSPPARLATAYKTLAASAQGLNAASDELSQPVSEIDRALQRLNLGLTVWEKIHGEDDAGTGDYWSRDVGYAKVKGTWGIAIRTTEGNHAVDRHDSETWLFDDAPRPLRIDAIEKLPEVLERLTKASEKTTRKLKERAAQARELADALKTVAGELKKERVAAEMSSKTGVISVKLPRKEGR